MTRSIWNLLVTVALVLPQVGCSVVDQVLFPPQRLGLSSDERMVIDKISTRDPERGLAAREEMLTRHPEWPDEVKDAVRAGELSKAMTRVQALSAWGWPSWRSGGMITASTDIWKYRRAGCTVQVDWLDERLHWAGYNEGVDALPRGRFGYQLP
jgi:hypothetical protein